MRFGPRVRGRVRSVSLACRGLARLGLIILHMILHLVKVRRVSNL